MHKRYIANKCPKDRVESNELNKKGKEITSDSKDRAIESRLKRLQVVITYASTENCEGVYAVSADLNEACNIRSLKVKTSSELQLLILGHLNATMGKKMHEHLPQQFGRFLPEGESSRIGELKTEMTTELRHRISNSFLKKKTADELATSNDRRHLTKRLLSKSTQLENNGSGL